MNQMGAFSDDLRFVVLNSQITLDQAHQGNILYTHVYPFKSYVMLEKTLTDISAEREHIDTKFKGHFFIRIYIKDGSATFHSSEHLFQKLP